MPEQATLTIVVQDSVLTADRPVRAPAPLTPVAAPLPSPVQSGRLTAATSTAGGTRQNTQTEAEPSSQPRRSPRSPMEPFDAVAEAQRLLAIEQRKAQVRAEMAQLRPPKPAISPAEEAQQHRAAEQRKAQVRAEMAQLRPPKPAVTPEQEADQLLQREERRRQVREAYLKLRPPKDPVAEAQEVLAREERRRQVLEAIARLRPPKDPVEEARELFEREEQRKKVHEELAKLRPAKDPVAEAQRLVELERERLKVRAEYLNQTKGPADALPAEFNPQHEARRRRADEVRRARVEAAYLNQYEGPGQALDPREAERRRILGQRGTQQGMQVGGLFGGAGGQLAGAFAGGGGQALAAAAGPAAIAAVAMEVKRGLQELIRSVTVRPIEAAGQVGEKVARGDTSAIGDVATGAAGAFGDVLQKATGDLIPFGDVIRAGSQAVRSFAAGLDDTARRFAQYNGPLAVAQSMANVRQQLGDLRRANDIGPELAKWVDARSRTEQSGQDLLVTLLKPLIPVATKAAETIADIIEWLNSAAERLEQGGVEAVNKVVEVLNAILKVLSFGAVQIEGLKLSRPDPLARERTLIEQMVKLGLLFPDEAPPDVIRAQNDQLAATGRDASGPLFPDFPDIP